MKTMSFVLEVGVQFLNSRLCDPEMSEKWHYRKPDVARCGTAEWRKKQEATSVPGQPIEVFHLDIAEGKY